jgi:hypothetical protein
VLGPLRAVLGSLAKCMTQGAWWMLSISSWLPRGVIRKPMHCLPLSWLHPWFVSRRLTFWASQPKKWCTTRRAQVAQLPHPKRDPSPSRKSEFFLIPPISACMEPPERVQLSKLLSEGEA